VALLALAGSPGVEAGPNPDTLTAVGPGAPVALGDSFTVNFDVDTDEATFQGYAVYMEYDQTKLAATLWTQLQPASMTICAGTLIDNVGPPGHAEDNGCAALAAVGPFTGTVSTLDMTCLAEGVDIPLDLKSIAEVGAFGSSLYAGGGAPLATTIVDGKVTCEQQADLEVTKTGDLTLLAGGVADYHVEAHNAGPNPAMSVIIADELPIDKVYVPLSAAVGVDTDGDTLADIPLPCVPGFIGAISIDVTGDTVPEDFFNAVMCSVYAAGGPLAILPSETVILDLQASVPLSQAGKTELNLGAAFSANPITLEPWTEDPDLSDNIAPFGQLVLPADVAIAKTAPGQVLSGDLYSNSVLITSNGPSPASAITITDNLPTNVTWQDNLSVVCSGGQGTTIVSQPVVGDPDGGWEITVDDPMAVGDTCTVTYDLKCAVAGTYDNTAEVEWADPLTDSDTATTLCLPPFNGMIKDARPDLPGIQDAVNLWLCKSGPDCGIVDPDTGAQIGKGALDVADFLFLREDTDSPNDSDTNPEGLAAYEEQLKFDHKIFDVEINDAGSDGLDNDADTVVDNIEESAIAGWRGNVNCTFTIVTENWIMYGCVSAGQVPGNPSPVGVWLKTINLTPDSDMFQRITPTKDNGVVRTILDENCEVADMYASEPWPFTTAGLTEDCSDLTVTVRMLEGDINLDCQVNVLDEQAIAYRYGASFGLLLYDPFYDLEPKLHDFDIDIKDIQFVFGRDGSECQNPIPNQDPSPAIPDP